MFNAVGSVSYKLSVFYFIKLTTYNLLDRFCRIKLMYVNKLTSSSAALGAIE